MHFNVHIETVSAVCWPVGWPAKCHTKRCLESWNNGAGHTTFVVWLTSQPVYYCGYIYVSLSGFLTMCPDLVLLTLFSSTLPLSWLLSAFLLSCSMFASSWTVLLVVCSLYCSHVLFLLLTCLMVYIAGFLLIMSSISVIGSVFMLDCLDWYCRYISAVTVVVFMCCLFLEMHLPLFWAE